MEDDRESVDSFTQPREWASPSHTTTVWAVFPCHIPAASSGSGYLLITTGFIAERTLAQLKAAVGPEFSIILRITYLQDACDCTWGRCIATLYFGYKNAKLQATQLFHWVRYVLHHDALGQPGEIDRDHDQFAVYFANKIDRNWMDFDSTSQVQSLDTLSTPTGHILWDKFQSIEPEDVDRIVGTVQPTPWPIIADQGG